MSMRMEGIGHSRECDDGWLAVQAAATPEERCRAKDAFARSHCPRCGWEGSFGGSLTVALAVVEEGGDVLLRDGLRGLPGGDAA